MNSDELRKMIKEEIQSILVEEKITFIKSDDFGEFEKDVKRLLKKYGLKTGKDLMENISRYAYSTKA